MTNQNAPQTNLVGVPSQTASDFVASLIRTAVPGIAGLVLGWLLSLSLPIKVSGLTQGDVQAVLTFIIGGLWYLIVRALETRWPKLGVLLGVPKMPTYSAPILGVVESAIATPADPKQPAAGVPPAVAAPEAKTQTLDDLVASIPGATFTPLPAAQPTPTTDASTTSSDPTPPPPAAPPAPVIPAAQTTDDAPASDASAPAAAASSTDGSAVAQG